MERSRGVLRLRSMLVLLCLVAAAGCATSRQSERPDADAAATVEVRAVARLLDDWVERVSLLPLGTAVRQQMIGPEPDAKVIDYLAAMLVEMPREDVYGIYLAFEAKKWSEPLAMPWVDRRSWPRATVVEYDYHDPKHEWYNGPKRTGKTYITEPYFDDGGSNITMVSVTRPIRDAGGRFIGVAGADLSLQNISRRARVSRGEMYLVSRAGKVISHPDARLMLRKGYDGEALKNLAGGAEVAAQPWGTAHINVSGTPRRLVWTTVHLTGWKVVMTVP
jgi:methyl-accepting chemotaxis protein